MRAGFRSPKYGHRGVYFLCTGPDPGGPRPGPRLQVVIYDEQDQVVRRFEQVEGVCLDEGHVSFFGGPKDRPARSLMPLVDIAPDGTRTVLVEDFQPGSPRSVMEGAFRGWVERHGRQAAPYTESSM